MLGEEELLPIDFITSIPLTLDMTNWTGCSIQTVST